MKSTTKDYKIVLYVTDMENDKVMFEKVKQYFDNCEACRSLRDLCRHLTTKNTPTVFLMTGDNLEQSMLNYYRSLDAVKDYTVCDHKVVSLIPLKSELDAFEAHRCNAIDDYLIARPLYEANRIVLIIEHLLLELGVALPSLRDEQVSNRLKNNVSEEFAALMSRLLEDKNQIELSFKHSIEDIESCLNQAGKKIQQQQAVDLDLDKLQETLKQIRSNEIRPKLLELQAKAISLLEKTITLGKSDNIDDTSSTNKADGPAPEFNRLYQQDINTLDDTQTKQSAIRILLVEDDLISQKLTMRLLSSFHAKTELAVSGRRALASLSSVKYDLILMDISLPDTNGIYILSQTKTEGHLNYNTPIVMLTGSKSKQIVAEALKNGAKGYVVKPLTKKTVQAIFDKHIHANH